MKNKKRILIVGNWKMNPNTLISAKEIFSSIKKIVLKNKKTDVVICPPFTFINSLFNSSKTAALTIGAQDLSVYDSGARTGEVSGMMIKSSGAEMVIVGHSEKRAAGDTDEIVNKKIQQALKNNLVPILCIGESIRDDHGEYLAVIKSQIKNALAGVSKKSLTQIIIAYEPVWAIGNTNFSAITGHELHQMYLFIKKYLKELYGDSISSLIKILYGGSVSPDNVSDLINFGEVNGFLVGRVSYDPSSFKDLLTNISDIKKK